MKKYKGFILLLSVMMLVTGCGSSEKGGKQNTHIKAVEDGEYDTILSDKSNQARILNGKSSGSMFDMYEVGRGLQELSKEYFSIDDYDVREGQLLQYNDLAASKGGLLGNQSDDNKVGLNPSTKEPFDLGNGDTTTQPFILTGIQEINFMQDDELKGIGVALMLRQEWYEDHESGLYQVKKRVSDERFQMFAEEAARKLVNYLRAFSEVGNDMPIYVALFNTSSDDEALPGHFFSQGYFVSRSTEFEVIHEHWYMFPSDAASKIDNVTAGRIETLKTSLYNRLPENVGVVGKGKYVDGTLTQLHITITMDAKSYVECSAMVRYALNQLEDFAEAEYVMKVELYSNKDLVATMVRGIGESEFTTHMMI